MTIRAPEGANNGMVLLMNNVKFIPFGLSFVAVLLVNVLLMLFFSSSC